MEVAITSPLRTATPERAMKPTAAGTENGMSRSHSASNPPESASGTPVNTTAAGKRWRNRPVVRVAEPGREFAFARTEPFAGTIVWRYRFEPVDGGTRVTESYEVERPISRIGWLVIERVFRAGDRRSALHEGMRTTLERLRVRVDSPQG